MNGYLQRLASQAAWPQGKVRPLVNPFTGPAIRAARTGPLDEGLLEVTAHTSVAQSQRNPKKTETPPGTSGQESKNIFDQNARDRMLEETEETSPFQPLLSATEEVSPTHAYRVTKPPRSGHESSREKSHSNDAHDRGSREIVVDEGTHARAGEDATRSPRVRRTPPFAEDAVREVHPHEVRVLSPGPAHRPNPHLPSKSTSASRGADDIQINIGRIEVTAMPQATPGPAPPVRKSVNLDEYLKHRTGRNG